jgi:hypothetical protein
MTQVWAPAGMPLPGLDQCEIDPDGGYSLDIDVAF